MSSFGLNTVLESVEETLPPVGEDELWSTNDWDTLAAQTQPAVLGDSLNWTGSNDSGNIGGSNDSFDTQAGMGEWMGLFDAIQGRM